MTTTNTAHAKLDIAAYESDSIISSVSSQPLRDVITGSWTGLGDLACQTLDLQLRLYHESQIDNAESGNLSSSSLFQTAASSIGTSLTDAAYDDLDLAAIDSLPPAIFLRAFGQYLENLRYVTICAAVRTSARSDGQLGKALMDIDIDEWILHNESYLRLQRNRDWRWGLVKFSSDCDYVFPLSDASSHARIVARPQVSGELILDLKKLPSLPIQPSISAYAETFDKITGSLLKGLDWSNLFVAGGIALAALLCTNPKDISKYENSDIDMYIYGLDPKDANHKLEHIHHIWKSNLPPGSEARVLRNSRTITFLSNFPTKRLQIVLKLVSSPKEVLLNFDLDPCSLGFDGAELWMLPRAARALLTGYSVFTMDLLHGHYLGQRRATQQQRVFKYADKGFGIRFLPKFINSLPQASGSKPQQMSKFQYTRYMWRDRSDHFMKDERHWQIPDFKGIMDSSRQWTRRWINVQIDPNDLEPMRCSHDMITDRVQRSSEPARHSALQSLARLMRHVALWEHECRGEVVLDNTTFASGDYSDSLTPIGYDDGPHYAWFSSFNFKEFERSIDRVNEDEMSEFTDNLERHDTVIPQMDSWTFEWQGVYRQKIEFKSLEPSQTFSRHLSTVRRTSLSSTLDEVLASGADSVIPVILPSSVMAKCNELILQALKDHGLPADNEPVMVALKGSLLDEWIDRAREKAEDGDYDVPVFWHIDAITAWQQIDRRIDEAYEILWAFRSVNATYKASLETRTAYLVTQLSRRAIRETSEDEFAAFAKWVSKIPVPITRTYSYMDEVGQFDSGDEDQTW